MAATQGPEPQQTYAFAPQQEGHLWPEPEPRVLVITSTSPGEGKTLTAVNLALMLAASEKKVQLIDADMRKPQTQALLKARRTPGLSDVLVGKAKPSEVIQQNLTGTTFSFLPAGTTVPSPADLLTARTLTGLLTGLRKFYDWIIIDNPRWAPWPNPSSLPPSATASSWWWEPKWSPARPSSAPSNASPTQAPASWASALNRAQIQKQSYLLQPLLWAV